MTFKYWGGGGALLFMLQMIVLTLVLGQSRRLQTLALGCPIVHLRGCGVESTDSAELVVLLRTVLLLWIPLASPH